MAGGVIKQTVQTDFKTTGANKVEKDTNRIGKAQTRLGQASASSGRQFSAQAQGLGGLVGAYAGAAATIFALSAAFNALNRAARAEQTITGVNALASAVGEQGPKIIRSIQEITKGQLSLVQAAELANLALSSGFSGQQIEQLADISLRASRALGRDLTDSFNRLVRGVTKLEPELLDELGIFVRIEPAAEAYAASIGKVASQLTAFEKRQAFANAVAAEGTEKFASIDTSAETTAESLESLVATLSDIGISVGGFIASVIQPLVEALGKPVTAIASFGILARAVFGRALVELQGSLSKVSDGAESFGDRIGDSIASTKKATQANAAYATSLDSIKLNQTRVSEANRGAFNSLIEGGRAATLNTTQIKELRDITEVELASVNKSIEAKNRQIATAKAAGRGTKTLEKQLQSLNNRQANFGNILDSTNSRLKASGPIARGAASSITFLGKAVAGAGRSILGVVAALGTFITIASIIVAVGSTILEAFGWLEPVTEFFKNSTETIRRWLGITKEASQQAKVAKEIANSLVESNEALFITGQRIDSLALVTGNLFAVQEVSSDTITKALQNAIASGATESADLFALSFRAQLIAKGFDVSTEDAKALFANIFGDIEGITSGQLQVISDFAEATGRTLKTAIAQVELGGEGTVLLEGAEDLPGLLSQAILKTKDYKNETGEARKEAIGINEAAIRNLQLQELSLNLLDSLNNGNATLEQIEKRRGAILNQISTIEKEIEKSSGSRRSLLRDSLALVESTLVELDREAQAQIAILSTRKQIRETFSSEIKASEKLTELFKLQETLGGNLLDIALDSNEADRARIAGLLQSYEIGKDALELQRSGVELEDRQAQLAALARDAQAALNGNFVKAIENARKLAEQVEKITDKQTDQLESLQLRIRIERESLKLTQQKLQLERDASRVKNENAITNALKSQVTAAFSRRQAIRDLRKEEALALNESIGGILAGPRAQRIEIAFATESLTALKAFNEEQRKLLTENFTREVELLNKQIAFQESQLADQGGPGGGTSAIEQRLALQNSLELAKIDATRDAQLVEIDLLEQRNQGILEEAKAFTDHIEGIASVLAADIVARRELLAAGMGRDFSSEATQEIRKVFETGTEAQRKALDDVGITLATLYGKDRLDVATSRRGLTALQAADTTPQLRDSLNQLITRLEDSGSFETARKAVQEVAEAETNLANLRTQSATATQIAEAERNLGDLRTKLTTLSINYGVSLDELTAVYGSQEAALNALNAEYARSQDTMFQIKNIIRDTLTNTVESGLMDLNTALIEGNLTFKSVAQGFKDMLGSMLKEIQSAVFRRTVAEPIAEFVGGLFAAGGKVTHLAAGGSMKRDRVAAMLEPGEFVIRKEAAKKLGMSKLQDLNAGISDDPIARIMAYAYGSKVKRAAGGKMTQEQLVAAQIQRERSLKSQRPTSTVKDLEGFGLGSEGTDLMNLMPGSFFGKALSQVFGLDMPSFVVGKTAAPLMDTPMKDEQLENTMKNIESKIGVSPTRTKGFIPGAVDPVTGGIFNSAGQAVNIDAFGRMGAAFGPLGTPSYTNFGSFVNAVMTPGNMAPLQGSIPGGPTAPVQVGGLGAGGSQYGGPSGKGGSSFGGYAGTSAGSDSFGNAPRASGGMITRMAAGGQVRDRVPALLEPGEFVIRRPAAKAIGGAALGAMNATGKATPNIAVNVNNQGVPKNVSVAPPRINGDKVILDIITRDLRNNGAIKKTMRRGK